MKYVMRAKYIGHGGRAPGIGYVDAGGHVTVNLRVAKRYDTIAEAWDHARSAKLIGSDEEGDWVWHEEVPEPLYSTEHRARPRCQCDHDQNGSPAAPMGRCCQCGKLARKGTAMAEYYVDTEER